MQKIALLFLIPLLLMSGCQGSPESQSKKTVESTDTKMYFSALDKMSQQDRTDAEIILEDSEIGTWIMKEGQKNSEPVNVIVLNLNEDKFKDMLVAKGKGYCGPGGCQTVALVSPKYDGYDILMQVDTQLPVYVKQGATGGLKDLFVDEKWLCRFSAEKAQYHCE